MHPFLLSGSDSFFLLLCSILLNPQRPHLMAHLVGLSSGLRLERSAAGIQFWITAHLIINDRFSFHFWWIPTRSCCCCCLTLVANSTPLRPISFCDGVVSISRRLCPTSHLEKTLAAPSVELLPQWGPSFQRPPFDGFITPAFYRWFSDCLDHNATDVVSFSSFIWFMTLFSFYFIVGKTS